MARSVWKREYIHPDYLKQISKKSKRIFLQNRATLITEERIDQDFSIYNGKGWFPIKIRLDMVGHRIGEFIPTRKRPAHKKKRIIKKKLWDKK